MRNNLHDSTVVPLKETVAEVETKLILKALEASGWVQARAARRLGISQRILGYKMKKYGITRSREEVLTTHSKGGER